MADNIEKIDEKTEEKIEEHAEEHAEETPKNNDNDILDIPPPAAEQPILIRKKNYKPIEKVSCLKCNKLIRKYDLRRHEELYCNAPAVPPPPPASKTPVSKQQPVPKQAPPPPVPPQEEDILTLIRQMNLKLKDNKQERYKNMMSRYYKS